MTDRLSRRAVLRLLPMGGLALATGCDTGNPHAGFLGSMERWNARAQATLFDPNRLSPEEPVEALTPEGSFPAYKISDDFPVVSDGWALKIGGLVDRPGLYSLEALRKLPRTDFRVRHHCVEGWSAVASWHGVRVSEIARLVGASARAPYVEFRSFDSNYSSSWDRPSAMHAQTILAYGRNGQPLPIEYGAPLRLYGAVKLGYKSVKYLSEVNFLPTMTGGYWEDRGYEWFAGV